MLYGKTSINPVSRFVEEISPEFTDSAPTKRVNIAEQMNAAQNKRRHTLSSEILKDSSSIGNVGKTQGYETFIEGDRVSHITLGIGTVIKATVMGADTMYEINFDDHGRKRLMATYAKLTKA